MHKLMDILEVKEIDLDVMILNSKPLCIHFLCLKKSHTFISKVSKTFMHQDISCQVF